MVTTRLMLVLCGTATAIAILVLALILGYTLFKGISYINLNILIQAAKPMGQAGRRHAQRNLRHIDSGAAGCVIALPIGVFSRDLPGRIRQPQGGRDHPFHGGYPVRCAVNRGGRVRLCHHGDADAFIFGAFRRRGTG